MTPEEYWKANRQLQHITPPGTIFPEVNLFDTLASVCTGKVFEFGCGYGRLAKAFHPSAYIGYDINPAALSVAKLNNPKHSFMETPWPQADTVLAHTVLLHIPDEAIQAVIDEMKAYKRIVIGEIMGRRWRRPGNPPVFNREAAEYEAMVGVEAVRHAIPYPRYNTTLTLMVFDL